MTGLPETTACARSQVRSCSRKLSSSAIPRCHPVGRGLSCGNSRGIAALHIPEVCLHSQTRVEVPPELPATRSDTLDHEERGVLRHGDVAEPPVPFPSGRSVHHIAPLQQGREHPIDEEVRPTEPGMVPGDVVGMHQVYGRKQHRNAFRKSRLPARASPVDGQDGDRPVLAPSPVSETADECLDRLSMPWSKARFLGWQSRICRHAESLSVIAAQGSRRRAAYGDSEPTGALVVAHRPPAQRR